MEQANEEPVDQAVVARALLRGHNRYGVFALNRQILNPVESSDEEDEEEEEEVRPAAPARRPHRLPRWAGGRPAVNPVETSDEDDEEEEEEEVRPAAQAPARRPHRLPRWAGGRPAVNPVVTSDEDDEEEEEVEEEEMLPLRRHFGWNVYAQQAVNAVMTSDEEDEEEDEDEEDEEEPEFLPEDDEDGEDDEDDEIEEDEEDEEDEVNKADEEDDEDDRQKVYSLYFKLQKLLKAYQLERSARGLPVQEIPLFDPAKITKTMWTTVQQKFQKHWNRMEELVDSVAEKKRKPRYEKLFRKPGEFKLPDDIREKMKTGEVQFIEYSIDLLRDALVKGTKLTDLEVFRVISEHAQLSGADDSLINEGKLAWTVDGILDTNEVKRRKRAFRRRKGEIFDREDFREMESQKLFLPLIGKHNYQIWTKMDIMDWIKWFIPLKAHWDLIEVQQFTGKKLDKFVKSKREWKKAEWPFGLYVQVKSHFNRVVNYNNGYNYQDR